MFGWEGKLPGLIISYDYPPPDVYESSVRMWEVLLDEELHHDGLVIGTVWSDTNELSLVSRTRRGFSEFMQKVERDYA
jgi:hypothetical protein